MANNDFVKVITGEVRLSYCYLFEPYFNPLYPDQEPKYKVTVLIPKTDTATKARLDAAIAQATKAALESKWNKLAPPNLPTPLHDGDGVRDDGTPYGPECKGHWIMTAKTKNKPQIVDAQLQPIMSQSEIYSGCYGRVSLSIFGYGGGKGGIKKGIGALLNNVQKLRDGEPLGGAYSDPAADFGAVEIDPITGQPVF